MAVKAGSFAARNMTIENSHFYGTHGISIGSETNAGVSNILFKNDTLSGTDSSGITSTSDNGMRIKSYSSVGGLVSTVTYAGICMTGVKDLLDIDPFYSSGNGSHIPDFTNIVVDGAKAVSSASGATSVLEGFSSSDLLGLTLENVSFDKTGSTDTLVTLISPAAHRRVGAALAVQFGFPPVQPPAHHAVTGQVWTGSLVCMCSM